MTDTQQPSLDFDKMARLANKDPAAFEQLRQEMLETAINQAAPSSQQRLRGLQWQIDQHRQTAGSPMAACLQISRMMWDQVLEDGGLLDNLELLTDGGQTGSTENTKTATIIQLHDPEK